MDEESSDDSSAGGLEEFEVGGDLCGFERRRESESLRPVCSGQYMEFGEPLLMRKVEQTTGGLT